MDVKKRIILLLALVYVLSSCSSQPTGGDEDFAVSDQTASSDTSADPAFDEGSSSSAANESPADSTNEFAEEPSAIANENQADNNAANANPQVTENQQNEFNNTEPALDNTSNAQEPPPQEIQPQELAQQEPAPSQPVPEPIVQDTKPVPIAEPEPKVSMVNLTSIQFKGNDTGGTLVIDANAPFTYTTRKNDKLNQVVIEIPNSKASARVLRPLNMKEFKGGIASV
ncbi:MAG: hypothetical protein L6Q37_04590, partial [Bdellovibrionaceae bacterium]|nr:hypothetical protein [Pseudobdellovibrionaceae bacterium]